MKVDDFFDAVQKMRELQKEYFKDRLFSTLKSAKNAEAEVDRMIKQIKKFRADKDQIKLF